MAIAKLEMVGLSPDVYRVYPSDLSGGMIKRVGLARALALDPEILFLDEPTSGLDPISAGEFDQLILTLQETLGISVFMVTHDLDSLHRVCDRIAVLGEGKIIEAGTMETMLASQHPWLTAYFHGARAHADWQVRSRVSSGAGRMEDRAKYVLIGVFTFAVIAGVFGFVYWLSATSRSNDSTSYRVIFSGAVVGLRRRGAGLVQRHSRRRGTRIFASPTIPPRSRRRSSSIRRRRSAPTR